jgi:hypothetical protein
MAEEISNDVNHPGETPITLLNNEKIMIFPLMCNRRNKWHFRCRCINGEIMTNFKYGQNCFLKYKTVL